MSHIFYLITSFDLISKLANKVDDLYFRCISAKSPNTAHTRGMYPEFASKSCKAQLFYPIIIPTPRQLDLRLE